MSKKNKQTSINVNPITETNASATIKKHVNTPRVTLHVAKRYESMHTQIEALADKWDVEMSNLIWHLLITNTTFEQATQLTERPAELIPITQKKVNRLEKTLGKLTPEQLEKLKSYLASNPQKAEEIITSPEATNPTEMQAAAS